MKICMVGMGSIGIQHTRNLADILRAQGTPFQIDALRSQGKELPEDVARCVANQYRSFDALPNDYDIVFVNTPTSLHFDHLRLAIDHARHIFIEKPVFAGTDHPWRELLQRARGVCYVACPLRYHSVIRYLKELVGRERIFGVRSICSSYLPDWRPGADYRLCYSAKAELGGGVRLDLIHEWDYLSYLFGPPLDIRHFHGKYSNLEITSEDSSVYVARYSDKLISLHLDYFGRVRRREVELYLADDVAVGDLYGQTIRFLKADRAVCLPQSKEELQKAELTEFLAIIQNKAENHNTIENAVHTLRITLGEQRT